MKAKYTRDRLHNIWPGSLCDALTLTSVSQNVNYLMTCFRFYIFSIVSRV